MAGGPVDALVVGCGPVGALLAARLGAAGWSVLVVERGREVFPLPRAVAADGEVLEILERAVPGLTDGFLSDPGVRFLAADRRELGRLQLPLALYGQPLVERRLRAHLARLDGVEVRLGVECRSVVQDDDGVTATVVPVGSDGTAAGGTRSGGGDGEAMTVRARWLIGCDGAASSVRRGLGVPLLGREAPHRWLVCDVEGPPLPDRRLVSYTCDPVRPQVDMPVPGGHRWEWLVRNGPMPAAAPLLAQDAPDAGLRVVREAPYRFAARRAARWQVGRVLLAGDAAHTMPPFAGQGLGAGLRDAWALGALLPQGEDAVAGYEPLRVPHLRRATALSRFLGALVQTRSPAAARARDVALRGAFATPRIGPWLRRGGPRPDVSGVLEL